MEMMRKKNWKKELTFLQVLSVYMSLLYIFITSDIPNFFSFILYLIFLRALAFTSAKIFWGNVIGFDVFCLCIYFLYILLLQEINSEAKWLSVPLIHNKMKYYHIYCIFQLIGYKYFYIYLLLRISGPSSIFRNYHI